jgi:hypothetical protein
MKKGQNTSESTYFVLFLIPIIHHYGATRSRFLTV